MRGFRRVFSYLINPRSTEWKISDEGEMPETRKVPLKEIFNPAFILGTIILTGLIIVVWFGPQMASYDPYITTRSRPAYFDAEKNMMVRPPFSPAPEYPLGTDRFGNDILSLILYGARATLISCLYITFGRILLGLVLGGLSGWLEGSWIDRLITRLSTVISSIPLLLSAMLMILALDINKGVWVFVVSLSVLGWTEIAQLVRVEFIRIKGMLYIEAAEALGMKRIQIFVRHAIPNVLSYLVSITFLEMGSILLIMAELGFLKIFVGGSTRFFANTTIPVVILITKIPEWGALVAQGTPYLRGHPQMALGPTMAFFISILGLNAFGEGIRKIFVRWPISTSFLLKKRMLLISGGVIGLSIVIFRLTGAAVSYQNLAQSIQEERLIDTYEDLREHANYASESEERSLVGFISDEFEALGLNKGYSEAVTSTYYFPAEAIVVKPSDQPRLRIGTGEDLIYQEDYAFLSEGCAGAGLGQGQIVFFGGGIDDLENIESEMVQGKILLSLEESYSPAFSNVAAERGVEGILVVTQEQPPLTSQFESVPNMDNNPCRSNTIPVYKIPESAASGIMELAHLDWSEELILVAEKNLTLSLSVQAKLELKLTEPELVVVPNVIGFVGGYDMDHANEILVVYTSFDGLGLTAPGQEGVPASDLAKIALLLEILSTWDEHTLDPRRSVQIVIWGGEGLNGSHNDLIEGLFEKNRMAAKVPAGSIKPAIWLEINDLMDSTQQMTYSSDSTGFLVELFKKAGRSSGIQVEGESKTYIDEEIGLPHLHLGGLVDPSQLDVPDIGSYIPQGVVINRVMIELLRNMEVGKN